jgi:beta-galactosidase
VRLKPDVYGLGAENTASVWAEMLQLEGAEAVVFYDHPFFGKYPAVTRNRFGKGNLLYEGTYPSAALQRALISEALERAGLMGADQKLPPAVKVRHGVASGRTLHYYLNVSGETRSVPYAYGDGVDLLTDQPVARGGQLQMEPWGVAIIGEGRR